MKAKLCSIHHSRFILAVAELFNQCFMVIMRYSGFFSHCFFSLHFTLFILTLSLYAYHKLNMQKLSRNQ